MRLRNVAFRQNITPESRSPEIVVWQYSERLEKETCYTIAWLKEGKESWHIETVGDRFTEEEDMDAVIHVAKYALKLLNLEKEFNEYNN